MNWVQNHNQYTPAAKAQFSSAADGWIIAYARVKGHVVVTHEQPAPGSKSKIKIPDVCDAFGMKYCNTFEMLARDGYQTRVILDTSKLTFEAESELWLK